LSGQVVSADKACPKVVLITGASAGIGAALAREAARKGYNLVVTARRADRLDRLAEDARALGVDSLVVPAALEEPGAPERIVAEAIAHFGRLDVVINNAGVGLPALFAESDPDAIRRQLDVNLVAPMLLVRHALPYLTGRNGVIINIGSLITAIATPGLGTYGPSKAGLAYFSKALRRELKHKGVNVCLVEPGPVKTEFFDAMRGLGPEPERHHSMLDAPYPWMTWHVEALARQVIRLIEHPRGRLSVPLRFALPWKLIGGLFQFLPWLGDAVVSSIVRFYEGKDARTRKLSRSDREAAKIE
jgi:short-subunit dehydrogenase